MSNPVVLVGNPNPPGVAVAPGAPMPAYQPLPGVSWTPPMTGIPAPDTITKHVGEQQNGSISAHHVARPWSNNYHNDIREGQMIFIARTANEDDEMQNMVNLYQFNHMLRKGYLDAMSMLNGQSRLPEGVTMSVAEINSIVFGEIPPAGGDPNAYVPGISESEIEEYIGREAAMELEVPDSPYKNRLKNALTLAKSKTFRYLWAPAIMHRWNFWGIVNNTSVGVSPEGRVQAANSHFHKSPTVVVNCIVAKKVYVSNVWGHKDVVAEGNTLYLILRRKLVDNGAYGPFEMVPDGDTNVEGVRASDTVYRDLTDKTRYGYPVVVGTCTEVGNHPPPDHKRRQAIGTDGSPISLAHDATGALPLIVVQVRV